MSYHKRVRGDRILEVTNFETGEVIYPFIPQSKMTKYIKGFTETDVSNIPKVLSNERKSVRGLSFRLLGTMVAEYA